jgi:hypothetical protein
MYTVQRLCVYVGTQLFFLLQVGRVCFFSRIKVADVVLDTVGSNFSHKPLIFCYLPHPKVSSFVVDSRNVDVVAVARLSDLSQIAYGVVAAIAINVVYRPLGPLTVGHGPGDAMHFAVRPVNHHLAVTGGGSRSSQIPRLEPLRPMNIPPQIAGARIVSKHFSKTLNGNGLFWLWHLTPQEQTIFEL